MVTIKGGSGKRGTLGIVKIVWLHLLLITLCMEFEHLLCEFKTTDTDDDSTV